MKKLKSIWDNNRVMFVLGIVILICSILVLSVGFRYFFGNSSSSYGDRLDDISDMPFASEDIDLIKTSFGEHIYEVSVDVKGKIVYIIATFDGAMGLDNAKNAALDVYNKIDTKYRSYYDYNFTITQTTGDGSNDFCLMGAKNVSSDNFVWSNLTPVDVGE